tara:strand:- start:118 stop:417 length:300 start_codon:yes stop_codon:yes gene_type:complete
MENFGKFMTIVIMMIISPIVNGYVFTKLWMWFIVPTFNIHPIRLIEAVGILLLVNFIKAKKDKAAKQESFWSDFIENVIFMFLMAGFVLLSGWVFKMFM